MPTRWSIWLATILCSFAAGPAQAANSPAKAEQALSIEPAAFVLEGGEARQRLAVVAVMTAAKGKVDPASPTTDCTLTAKYLSSAPGVASVSADGIVTPHADGTATIEARALGGMARAQVTVDRYAQPRAISFRNQIVPIFSRYGCNSGGCHGKATGQNGFKLSLLGFDPQFDYGALVKEARGRRVFPAAPEQSLLLLKASASVPHGGGLRIKRDSAEYSLLRRWIEQGALPGSADDPQLVSIKVWPQSAVMARHAQQRVIVTAEYSDGHKRDVTHEAQFKSNAPQVAGVDDEGAVTTDDGTGDTAVMARYLGHVDVCRIMVPLASAGGRRPKLPPGNYVDRLVEAKWKQLKLAPSPLCDDATFLRRLFLDTIGTLPTPEEVREFLADTNPQKRAAWIDRVLARNEYADFWTAKWGELLRNKRRTGREAQRGTYAFHAWIRNAFASNMPYDRFVRGIVAAQGTVDQHPPVIWYREVRNLVHQTNDTAQLFLGTRINCAQCHHHPYEKWSQDDYYQFQAFFARLGRKSGESAAEPAIYVRPDGEVFQPVTRQLMQPRGLDGPPVVVGDDEDRRQKLVDWMAEPSNPMFAAAICNRYWAHFLGRGLVEPLDDMRVTNPPSNPPLVAALAEDLVKHHFDLKHLVRTILNSTTYQLASDPTPDNIDDEQNYARAYPRRVMAEVILDAVSQVTGTVENFGGLPKGTRAIQLPDESIGSYFLDVFGRPQRETACECERPREANLAQALHMLNSVELQSKVSDGNGRIAQLVKDKKPSDEVIDELYLAALSRYPRGDERRTVLAYVAAQSNPRLAWEDLVWAMVNTKEFLFNH
jgi:hypothetical protein